MKLTEPKDIAVVEDEEQGRPLSAQPIFGPFFLTPFLGSILGLLFNTATGSLQAFQEHAETQVLAFL